MINNKKKRGSYVRTDEIKMKNALVHLGKKQSRETVIKRTSCFMGKNHWNWKGGISKVSERIRKLFEYRQWRSDIFQRDNYTCQICNQIGWELNADHIKPFYLIIEENKIETIEQAVTCQELWNLNNGRTLCKSCHMKTDTWGRQKRNDDK